MRADQQIVNQTNKLARAFYRIRGYVVDSEFKFYADDVHPHVSECWHMACEAQLELTETDVDDCLLNLELI